VQNGLTQRRGGRRGRGREGKRGEEIFDAGFHSVVQFGLVEIQPKFKVVQI